MGHLVPQRRLPVEFTGSSCPGRIKGDNLSEASAQRPDHARQPQSAHGEVVMLRKYLDQNRTLRSELIECRELVKRTLTQLEHIVLEDGSFVRVEPNDKVALLEGFEFIQRIEHFEKIKSDDIVRIDIKRPLERPPCPEFVACTKQVHPKLSMASTVVWVDLESTTNQSRRLFKSIIPCG